MSARKEEKQLQLSVSLPGGARVALIKPGLVTIDGDQLRYSATEVEVGLMRGFVDLFNSQAVEDLLFERLFETLELRVAWKALINKLNYKESSNYIRLVPQLLKRIPLKLVYKTRNSAGWTQGAELVFRDQDLESIAGQLVGDIEVSGRYTVKYESFCGRVLIPGKGFVDVNQVDDFKTFLLDFHQKSLPQQQSGQPGQPEQTHSLKITFGVAGGDETYNLIPSKMVDLNDGKISVFIVPATQHVQRILVELFCSAGVRAVMASVLDASQLARWDSVVVELQSVRQERMLLELMKHIPLKINYKDSLSGMALPKQLRFETESIEQFTRKLIELLGHTGRFQVNAEPGAIVRFNDWVQAYIHRMMNKANFGFLLAHRGEGKYLTSQARIHFASFLFNLQPVGLLATEGEEQAAPSR
jgi:hypothetical protein